MISPRATRSAARTLRRGDFTLRWVTDRTADESDAGIVAFERRTEGGGYVLVVINSRGDKSSRTSFEGESMEVGAAAGSELRDVLGAEGRSVTVGGDGRVDVELGPYEGVVLVPVGEHRSF